MFDEYRHFLSKKNKYRKNEQNIFNGKKETALKPQRMTPHLWNMQYNRNLHHDTNGSSYMNCYVFYFYCELFIVVSIFDL